jgi:PPP family 3-phenylpropionic acid transporter
MGLNVGQRQRATLGAFYFCQFATLGVYLPYFGLYLERRGFAFWQIGTVMAAVPVMKALLPPLWGHLADRTGRRRALVVFTCAAASAAFALLIPGWGFGPVLALMLLYGVFAVPVLPMVEVTTLEVLARHGGDYGRVRVWGSMGFIVFALAWGPLADRGLEATILPAIALLFAANAVTAWRFPPAERPPARIAFTSLLGNLKRPEILLFLGACVAIQASHGPYYEYFTIHLVEVRGHAGWVAGILWSLGVACEVVVMITAGRWLRRMRLETGIALSLAGGAVRWALYSTDPALPLLAAGQALHGLSFALFHVSAVQLTARLFPAHQASGGQAFYSASTFGLGTAIGFQGAGMLYSRLGAPGLFTVATAVAAAGLLAALALRRVSRRA